MAASMEKPDRTEAAIYWSAVSLIVCEGLPIDKAAEQLGVGGAELREILNRRQTLRLVDHKTTRAPASGTVVPFIRH